METALHEAGSCGRFQVLHFFITQIPRFTSTWAIMLMMFVSHSPGWRCNVGRGENDTTSLYRATWNENISMVRTREKIAFAEERGSSGTLEQDTYFYGSKNASSDHLNKTSDEEYFNGSCKIIKLCDDNGIDFNPKSITLVSEFNLICDREWILKAFVVIQSVGFLIGALSGGQIGERYGRKASLYIGQVIISIFTGIAIFSFHWIMYAVCLLLIGFGAYSSIGTSQIFPMEFLNSKWRGLYYAIPVWNVSLFIFTVVSTMMKNWVYVHIVTCLISLIGCTGYFIIPESLRWLAVHGYQDEVDNVIRKIARINKRPPPSRDVLEKLQEEYDNSESKNVTYSYMDIFKKKILCILMIKFIMLFIVIYITYYSLGFGVTSLPGHFYTNLIVSSICEISMTVLSAFLCNKIGRRWTGLGMSMLGVASCGNIVVIMYTAEGSAQTIAITSFAFIARGSSMGMTAAASLLLSEHFPTAVRSVAFGLSRSMAGVGGIISPFLIPSPSTESFTVCYVVITCIFGFGFVIFMLLSETNQLCLIDKIDESLYKARKKEDECTL